MFKDLPELLTVEEAATALRIGRSKAYALTVEYERTGGASGLPFIWCGGQKRAPRHALVAYVQKQIHRRAA